MKSAAITLILRIAGSTIRSGNSQPNLAKFQREMRAVKTFALPIPPNLQNLPRFCYGDYPLQSAVSDLSTDFVSEYLELTVDIPYVTNTSIHTSPRAQSKDGTLDERTDGISE